MSDDSDEINRLLRWCEDLPKTDVPPPDFWAEMFTLLPLLDRLIDRLEPLSHEPHKEYVMLRCIRFRKELRGHRVLAHENKQPFTHASNINQV